MTYVAASETACNEGARPILAAVETHQLDFLIELAKASTAILASGRRIAGDGHVWRKHLRRAPAGEASGRAASLNTRQPMADAATESLSFLEPIWPRLFGEDKMNTWMGYATDEARVVDPVLKILTEKATGRITDWTESFGDGPWPCMNPISGHFREKLIESIEIRKSGRGIYADFACRCGYTYTRGYYPDGHTTKPRLKDYVRPSCP